jgi:hypothetical protein
LAIKSDLWRIKRPYAQSIGSQYSELTKTDKVFMLRNRVLFTISYIHKSKVRYLKEVTGLGGKALELVLYMNPVFPTLSGTTAQYLEKHDSKSSDPWHDIMNDNI